MNESKKVLNHVSDMCDIMMGCEFKNLTPMECLLKIFKENKKYKEDQEKK